MFYKVHIVEDAQIAADWALVDGPEAFHLFVTRSADNAQTYADAHLLMRTKRREQCRAAVPQPRPEPGLLIRLPA